MKKGNRLQGSRGVEGEEQQRTKQRRVFSLRVYPLSARSDSTEVYTINSPEVVFEPKAVAPRTVSWKISFRLQRRCAQISVSTHEVCLPFRRAEFIPNVIPPDDDAKKRDGGWEERQESTSGKEYSRNIEISEYRV